MSPLQFFICLKIKAIFARAIGIGDEVVMPLSPATSQRQKAEVEVEVAELEAGGA